jgi:hypothetical protein
MLEENIALISLNTYCTRLRQRNFLYCTYRAWKEYDKLVF